MEETSKKRVIENNKRITKLLLENERIIRDSGFQPPVRNCSIEKDDRITLPSGYIRTSSEFWQLYHLDNIVKTRSTGSNIAYALQLLDFYDYLINRFKIWGSIETMLFKQAIVNIASIIEALVLECANRINNSCQKCPKIGKCENVINKHDRANFNSAFKRLYQLGILILTEDEYSRLTELYELRNRIHIRLSQQNEYLDNKYNHEMYKKSIRLLYTVDEQIWKNGIRLYHSCIGFVDKNN